MIVDTLDNIGLYSQCNISPYLEWAVNRLRLPLTIGREEIEFGGYALICKNEPKESNQLLEAHKKFIDLHIVIQGREKYLYSPTSKLELFAPYHEQDDVTMYTGRESATCDLEEDMFVVFYPGEGHTPNLQSGSWNQWITKIVLKIPVK